MPVLSVVIANYNYGCFIKDAIRSVIDQNCNDVELIVIDGGSSDNSVDVIRQYENKIAYWISEKDKGQSDAFNKGFSHARGQFLTWLNADDVMLPGSLAAIVDAIKKYPLEKWFCADTLYADKGMNITLAGLRLPNWLPRLMQIPSWARITAPSTIFSKELFEAAGGFDENLHYVMDTDLWIKFSKIYGSVRYIKTYAWCFRLHENSKTTDSVLTHKRNALFAKERELIRTRQGITPTKDRVAVLGKRLACSLSLSYLRRRILLAEFGGKHISEFCQ